MKAFFISLFISLPLLSASQAPAQPNAFTAPPVTFFLPASSSTSDPWRDISRGFSDSSPSFARHWGASLGPMPRSLSLGVKKRSADRFEISHQIFVADSTFLDCPYQTRFKKEGPLAAVGISLYGASVLLKTKELPLSAEKVIGLEKNQISRFDRGATRHYSTLAQQTSDLLVASSLAMPLLYLTKEKTRKDFRSIFLMQAETLLLTTGLFTLTKTIVYRPRPFTYNTTVPIDNKLNLNARESFFSGHVATSASMSFFTASIFSQYFPHSPLKPVVWTYAIVWPAATGYFRYAAGKHFPTDILTGYIVGAVTGIVIPKIHQKIRKGK